MCPSNPIKTAAVVVDPYSSGKYLLIDLHKREVPIIAVRSTTKMSDQFLKSHEANSKYFAEMLEFEDMEGGLQQLTQAIHALTYKVVAVIPGSEPGVELANRLSHDLGLASTNPLDLLPARTDKAEMQEALRRNNVPAAKQFKSGDLDHLLSWARKEGQWPLVAKPIGGAGSEGIFFCKSEEDICDAHRHIIGNRSSTGALNSQLALQEFLSGDEYIVDTVSHEGKHLCIGIWVYKKLHGLPWAAHAIMPQQNMLLPPTGSKQDELTSYVFQVLDAVGLKNGPCHTEIMFTERGPILVEVNARMHGLQGPRLLEECTGISKATYTTDALVFNGELFQSLYREADQGRYLYPVHKHCVNLCLISPVSGILQISLMSELEKMNLASAFQIIPAVQKGGRLAQTKDLPTLAGTVLLVHESMEQIEQDIKRIRDAEASLALYPVTGTLEAQSVKGGA